MGKRKIWRTACLCLLLCLCMGIPAFAENSSLGVTKLKKAEVEAASLDDGINPIGTYLSYGSCGITEIGSGIVYISGDTSCYRVSDEVYVGVYLERLGGSWYTVSSKEGTGYNTAGVQVGKTIAVTKGYYYRARGAHYATKGSTYESTTSVCSGIYID